jgi:protein-disulfide isomerase
MALAAALLSVPADAAPARRVAPVRRAAPTAVNWTRTVVATPEGGFRIGNPNARVKLIEYGSLVCPHCAQFSREGMAPLLANYVRGGKVSYEFRNYVLNSADIAATLVARCGGAARFFPMSGTLLATQNQWIGRIQALPAATIAQMNAAPPAQQFSRIAEVAGLVPMAARYGVPAVQARRCAGDKAAADRLVEMVRSANGLGVTGTPTFFFNGADIGTHTWATLEPILRDAAG